jgi:hypothetical protein
LNENVQKRPPIINETIVPIDGPRKKLIFFLRIQMILIEKFYQNFEMTEELFVLLLVPMLPKNEILSAKDHPIINKK